MRKNLVYFTSLILVVCFLCGWSGFDKEAGALFTKTFSKASISYNSTPVITKKNIYVTNTDTLYEMDLHGKTLRTCKLSAKTDSRCDMRRDGNYLYIPLHGGFVECVKMSSLKSVWKSEPLSGQSLASVTIHDGYLYTGTTNMTSSTESTGVFYCLDASSGKLVWKYEDTEHPGGYYWSGGAVLGNAIYFAGDNGILVSHSLRTDEVYDKWQVTNTAKIRAGIVVYKNALYTVSTDGTLYYALCHEDGSFNKGTYLSLHPGKENINCTSTPTIYDGKLYVGSIADSYGYLSVIDIENWNITKQINLGLRNEVKSTPLIDYTSDKNNVRVYFTCNSFPGALYGLCGTELKTIYTPKKKQFCISGVSQGADGTLYYSNDSGTFFAINRVPQTPTSIKVKTKKKKTIVTWKKGKNTTQTIVYYKVNKKWKKLISTKKKCVIKTKKKITHIKLRGRKKINGKWYYSSYSRCYKIKK